MKNHLKKIVCLMMVLFTVFTLAVSASAFDNAEEVSFGQIVYNSISSKGEDDYFKFTTATYGRVRIGITTGLKNYTLSVYNEAKEEKWKKAVNNNTASESVTYDVTLDAGTYYFKVEGVGDSLIPVESTGDYNFKLSFTATTKPAAVVEDKDTDTNNSLDAAKAVALEKTNTGKLYKEDEEDFYKFTLPSSGSLEFAMLSKMQYYCAYLLDANGNQIWSTEKNEWDSSTKQRKDSHKLELAGGDYYLKVNGYRSSTKILKSTGSYQFELYFVSAGETTVEPNNSLVEAKMINLDTVITGHLAMNDSKDAFEINVAAGDMSIGFVSYMNSYNVVVYDETYKEIWSSKDNAKDEDAASRKDLHEVSLGAGKYYLVVTGTNGKYTFALSQNGNVGTVKNIKYKKTTTSITLSWAAVTDAEGYEVYKFDEDKKEFVKIGATTKNYLKVKNLKSGTSYDFKIKAYKKLNTCEIYGELSEEKATTTMPAKAVISKIVSSSKNSAKITWNKVEGASGYRIFYSRSKDFDDAKRIKIKDGETTEKVVKKLKSGKKYYFKVRAYKTFNGKKLFGALSRTKAVKVLKK